MLTIHTMFARCEINQDATLRSRSSEAEAPKCIVFTQKLKAFPCFAFSVTIQEKLVAGDCQHLLNPPSACVFQKNIWNAVQCSCRIVPICLNDHKGLRFRLKLRHLCFSHEASSGKHWHGKHWQGEMIWECQSKRESKTAAALPEGSA